MKITKEIKEYVKISVERKLNEFDRTRAKIALDNQEKLFSLIKPLEDEFTTKIKELFIENFPDIESTMRLVIPESRPWIDHRSIHALYCSEPISDRVVVALTLSKDILTIADIDELISTEVNAFLKENNYL